MDTYPITQKNKDQERAIINKILKNNGYRQLAKNFRYQTKIAVKPTQTPPNPQKDREKWATFTYFGPETRIITNLFRSTNVKNCL
jgi:hypothetical protein